MCLLAISYRQLPGAPILVAANRDEAFDRPFLGPQVQSGSPKVLCPTDAQAGGTWLGVNEHGVLVAVTNRAISTPPPAPRSRGLLCRELLECATAAGAAQRAFQELSRGRYAGANYVCLDPQSASVVYGGDRLGVLDIKPGLHLMTNADLDDDDDRRQVIARRLLESVPGATVKDFIDQAARTCAAEGVVVRQKDRGTVCSELVAVATRSEDAVYRHAPGPPDRTAFEDHSAALRGLLRGSDEATERRSDGGAERQ